MPPTLVLQSAHHTNDWMNQATMDGNLLSLSQPLANSSIAIPNLETIPGSAAATPALRDSPPALSSGPPPAEAGPSRHPLAQHSFPSTPDGDSRRSSISSFLPGSGSYFPARSSASTASTPSERPRPTPINIPAGTPDEPLFSAYPDTVLSPANKSRNFTFPLQPAFQLSPVAPRRREDVGDEGGSRDSSSSAIAGQERDRTKGSRNRRRAATLSHLSPEPDTQRTSSLKVTRLSVTPTRSLKVFRRRRSSLSFVQPEFGNDPSTQWPSMAREEARRLEPPPTVPFAYQQSSDSDYTLQSISTIATVRPLASPTISPRRSSLVALPDQHDGGVQFDLSHMPDAQGGLPVEIVIPEDMTMPHEPPPRRSSLSLANTDPKLLFEVRPADPDAQTTGLPAVSTAADGHSVLSASLTGTDTSVSAEYYSTSPSSKEHPLSSASTSLSRSAKSGKEGMDDKDDALTVLRLQRSLEWEARQGQHRRQLEKRKMVLLELVETEVAYVEDLKALVHVYLPQLYALPSISQRTAARVARNAGDLLEFHIGFAQRMVAVLREEGIGYEPRTEDSAKLERTARRLSELFVDELTIQIAGFGAYKEFCAGSIAAATLVRHISMRSDYNDFEKRCQYITSKQTHTTLHSLLADDEAETTSTNRSRLHFRDFLITPVQRICRYPLLLAQLLNSAQLPGPAGERPTFDLGDEYDVGVDIERALGAMRGAAEDADEARRVKEVEIKSATVIERLEPHPALSPPFLRSLGACRLIGSLDVLYHHPTLAPLMAPVKVKYLAAFLYRGYLILAKVKKGKSYEAKHYFPLEVFELIDITEGFLPHSIRLMLREHNFDLAASCEAEKDVWSAALCEARDESTVPPFELPASVSPFAARSRRVSLVGGQNSFDFTPPMPSSPSNKRHTLAGAPSDLPFQLSIEKTRELTVSPLSSPIQTSFDTPDRRPNPQSNTVLLRRASTAQRLIVDRALMDVFSESCATARSKAQLQRPLFIPDHPVGEPRDRLWKTDSPTIQRRRSFLDVRPYGRPGSQNIDIAFSGKIRGSVVRRTHSSHGKRHVTRRREIGSESATEVEGRQSADETVMSDFGTLMGREYGGSTSIASDSPLPSPLHQPRSRRSIPSLRRGSDEDSQLGASSSWAGKLTLNRRKTASTYYLNSRPHAHDRSKSMPVSPARTPGSEMPPPPPLFKSASEESTLRKTQSGYFDGPAPSPSPANAPPADRTAEGSKGTWATLRRSMSFIRSGSSSTRYSQVSLVDLSPSPARTSDEQPVSERVVSSDDEIDRGVQRDVGTMVESASSGSGFAAEADGDGGASGGTGSLPGTPRRRRSTRLLRSLSRFTPFEMVQ
ncbi:hypothetical protein BCR39DRAFT_507873 [Naematelia encephala]|uniref:DH domain-containing protein n=1 Tax=Naematelia encephala TaxID=71784 RepID=A0A1Y2AL32_9TREE|nr:hypothetical protein BCR39DRAFT_507873 [Naematelia encephala]